MAINNTGAMFKSFEFDGTDSRDFGVYITGAAVYNAPEREVEMISIPNRNGAFALDKGRFENIEITYPAGIYADTETDFAEAISDLRNFLCSKRGYCRLTDEYNPNEYRMAIYKSGLEVEPSLLKAGEFEITFECMPQRYLNSGDEEIEVGEWGETETKTGDIVTIDNTDGLMAVKSLNVSLLPVQDLHGYDKPWRAGAGVNKWDEEWEVGGLVYADGTPFSASDRIRAKNFCQCSSGTTYYCVAPTAYLSIFWYDAQKTFISWEGASNHMVTSPSNAEYFKIVLTDTTIYGNDISINYPSTVTTYSPYENICPITGRTQTDVVVTDGDTQSTTTTVTLPHTVYGADVDVTGGEGKEKMAMIDLGTLSWSYSSNMFIAYLNDFKDNAGGSTGSIPNAICSAYEASTMANVYGSGDGIFSFGTTSNYAGRILFKDSRYTSASDFRQAMNGVYLCYELAAPTDLQTTPTDVELLTGVNNISSPQGEITIEYGQNPNIVINPTLFDAEPMLEVYGYGTINIGSKIVTLYDQPVGDIVVAEQAKNSFSTTTVEIDDTYANLGDEITFERIFVQTDSRAPNNQYIYTPSITVSGTGVTVSADVEVNGRQLLTTITLDSDSSLVFAYGTSKSVSAVANSSFTVHGSTVTSTTTIGLSYDGDKTFTLSRSVTFSQAGYALMMNNTFNLLGPTHLNSTQNLLGNPTYIDLSIGEAYRIDGDSAASLNNAVVLPIELPTLPKGETEITFDNTVTRLDIVPRWWKI